MISEHTRRPSWASCSSGLPVSCLEDWWRWCYWGEIYRSQSWRTEPEPWCWSPPPSSSCCWWCSGSSAGQQAPLGSDQHKPTHPKGRPAAHRDVEVDAAFVFVVADKNRLHPNVRHVNGSREEEEDGQPRQQQADQDRCWHVQLPVDKRQQDSMSTAIHLEIIQQTRAWNELIGVPRLNRRGRQRER